MSYSDLRKGRHSEPGRVYFVTTVLAERERRYFADFDCARLVVQVMRSLHQEHDVDSIAWVIMPDHIHWLFQLGPHAALSEVMKKFKARSALAVNRHLHRQGPLWQKAFYDHALRDEDDIRGIARYIVANPLRAGLVDGLGQYAFWDAKWL
jgi:REP element-mobilizing transposase RayT